MRRWASVAAVGLLLALPAGALAKTTSDFTFKSDGSAAVPALQASGTPGTFQDIPFTIAPDDADGAISVSINWTNQFDDWDLYVYRKSSSGELEQVGNSAGGPPSTQENAVITATTGPIDPGQYVIRVQNYAASNPDFTGFAKFSVFVPGNEIPRAVLRAPSTAGPGQQVTLDASGSRDVDGQIVEYDWDLDGNGTMETGTRTSPTVTHAFERGVHHVAVRVIDNSGARGYANATIDVGQASARTSPGSRKTNHRKHRRGHRHLAR